MSSISDIQEKLQDTQAAIAHAEREIAKFPDVSSLQLGLRSLEKRRKQLEVEFSLRAGLPEAIEGISCGIPLKP